MKARHRFARQTGSNSVSLTLECEDGFGSACVSPVVLAFVAALNPPARRRSYGVSNRISKSHHLRNSASAMTLIYFKR
jgi:hypothetical protein